MNISQIIEFEAYLIRRGMNLVGNILMCTHEKFCKRNLYMNIFSLMLSKIVSDLI